MAEIHNPPLLNYRRAASGKLHSSGSSGLGIRPLSCQPLLVVDQNSKPRALLAARIALRRFFNISALRSASDLFGSTLLDETVALSFSALSGAAGANASVCDGAAVRTFSPLCRSICGPRPVAEEAILNIGGVDGISVDCTACRLTLADARCIGDNRSASLKVPTVPSLTTAVVSAVGSGWAASETRDGTGDMDRCCVGCGFKRSVVRRSRAGSVAL